ncbi:GyrI-like domain-containing protein [Neolewinella antarctica]|uniref:Effector-binding domain-containing protein n=1 Tax=Neolewinella antarctica TaxID=442734 RepID=A0ABX0X894_9BACT|nr:GyrI-like domain-containing protein [Neolewinella antarctica]NJC25221.1 effector-binding domain-containing protein [Neolewinella antarctica]
MSHCLRLFAFLTFCLLLVLVTSCNQSDVPTTADGVREGGDSTTQTLEVAYVDLELPDRTYLVFRQELSFQDVNGFIAIETDSLVRKSERAGVPPAGPATLLTYGWDTERGRGDVAVALPVEVGTTLSPYATVIMPAGPALSVEFAGSYDRLSAYHYALGQELANRGLRPLIPSIEEYVVGPTDTRDAGQFRTRIIYPYANPE